MKKAFLIALVLLGVVFVGAGTYTVYRGFDAKGDVRAELLAQNIRTPPDASIPNAPVLDPATAVSMADIIDVHAREATGDLTYAEMGRFLAENGDRLGTNIEADALVGPDNQPVRNPLRSVALEAATVRTGLYASVMAFNVADLVVGLGLMILVLGLALGGLGVALGALAGVPVPARARRLHLDPIVAPST